MSDFEKLIEEIIPPADYSHRNGFNNESIIDKLDVQTKIHVEDELICKLSNGANDVLIVETLAYLKSLKALPILYALLENETYASRRLIIATSIFELNSDERLIDLAIYEFKRMKHWSEMISAFYYLAKFDNVRASNLIASYTDSDDYLIAYNAKRYLSK